MLTECVCTLCYRIWQLAQICGAISPLRGCGPRKGIGQNFLMLKRECSSEILSSRAFWLLSLCFCCFSAFQLTAILTCGWDVVKGAATIQTHLHGLADPLKTCDSVTTTGKNCVWWHLCSCFPVKCLAAHRKSFVSLFFYPVLENKLQSLTGLYQVIDNRQWSLLNV